jgi:hypothetical protein
MNPCNLTRPLFRAFLIIFCTANGYILLSGGTCFWLANKEKLTPEQTRIFDTCNNTWNDGTNTIFRLLDHKLLDSLQANDNEN